MPNLRRKIYPLSPLLLKLVGRVLILCLSTATYLNAYAQTETVSLTQVTTSYFSTNSDPQILPDGKGGFFAIFKSMRGANYYASLFAQHINQNGAPVWAADGIELCPQTRGSQSNARMIADGEGGLYFVWETLSPDDNKERLYAQRMNANGETLWGLLGKPICTQNSRQQKPQIMADGAGGLYIFWEDRRNGDPDIYGQRLDGRGSPRWEPTGRPIVVLPGTQQNMKIDLAPDKSALMMWEDFRSSSLWQISCQKIRPDGSLWWTSEGVPLTRDENVSLRSPNFFSDGFGGLVCCYEASGGKTQGKDVFFSRITRNGELAFNKAVCALPEDQASPRAALRGADAVVYWEDHRTGNADIFAQQIDLLDGRTSWEENGVPICMAVGEQNRPDFVASSFFGDQIIGWEDNREGVRAIYAQKVSRNGNPMWHTDGLKVSGVAGNQQNFQLAPDERGGAWVVWVDESEAKHSTIYYQHLLSPGKLALNPKGVVLQANNETLNAKIDYPVMKRGFAADAFVAWEDYRNGKKNPDIYLQRISQNGKPMWRKNGIPVCTAPGLQATPRILPVKNGCYVLWLDRRENDDDLFMQFVDTSGRIRWTLNGLPICRAPRSQSDVSLVRSEHERAIVAWTDARSYASQEFDIFLQIVDTTGAFYWGENGAPIAIDPSSQSAPALAEDGNLGANLVWMDMRSGYFNIFIQNINNGGVAQWQNGGYRVTRADAHQRYPEIFSANGFSYIVWADDRLGFDKTKIFIQKIDKYGRALFQTTGNMVCNQYGRQIMPQVISDDEGGVIVGWLDHRNDKQSDFNLFLQRIGKYGEPVWDKWGVKTGQFMKENAQFQMLTGMDDDFFLAWHEMDEDSNQTVQFEQHNIISGKAEIRFDLGYTSADRLHPSIVQFPNTRKLVLWLERKKGGKDYELKMKMFD